MKSRSHKYSILVLFFSYNHCSVTNPVTGLLRDKPGHWPALLIQLWRPGRPAARFALPGMQTVVFDRRVPSRHAQHAVVKRKNVSTLA